MNQINPKKLLNSKWIAVKPLHKEKHFTVINIEFDEEGKVILCEIEAVISNNVYPINWRDLKDNTHWQLGWK
ncbi:TIGR02450 family Trp-rich protein [Bermanella sp. R86510]|uniref:TIGR02450 family Trp-rich protein n=1 Tax=unclassified Bermanella TaxID=2627862 RepID=UPI0037C9DD21